jgi:hypothetical protein
MKELLIKCTEYPLFYHEWVTVQHHRIVSCKLSGNDYIVQVAA